MPGGREFLVHLWLLDLSLSLRCLHGWALVMGPSTVDMSTHTLTGYSWGAIFANGVIEQSCGCPGTRVVCSMQSVRRGGNSCLSWATVAVKHKLSLCSWGTLGLVSFRSKKICPPIHTPDSYPDSYPSAAICSQEPLALWAVLAKLCRPNPQKTQNSKRSTAGTSSRLFSQKFARRWVRKAYCDVSSATRYTTCERPTSLCAAPI